MATQALQQPKYIGSALNAPGISRFKGGPEHPYIKETASQAYVAGDLVYFDSSGTIAICTEDGTTHDVTSAIGGQAKQAASGVTGQGVELQAIHPSDIWEMNVYHGTLGSAVSAQSLLQPDVARTIKHVSSVWVVDIENAAEGASDALGRCVIVGFADEDAIGDTYGRVLVRFLEYSLASDGNPNKRVLQY